jgi:hypothetical protein
MSDPRETIALTEKRLAEVEALQLSLKETQLELTAYGELLRQQLSLLRVPDRPEPAARPTASAAPAAKRPTLSPPVNRSAPPVPPPGVKRAKPTLTDIDMSEDESSAVDLGGDAAREPVPEPEPEPEPAVEDDLAGEERRADPRRKGNPVSVQVSNEKATAEPFQGWVVDRSTGGVRLLVDQEVKPNTVLSVRPSKSHPGFTWVQVRVKSCKPERSSYNLGCQFMRKLTWAEMQAFG